jgi:hypothetical protein
MSVKIFFPFGPLSIFTSILRFVADASIIASWVDMEPPAAFRCVITHWYVNGVHLGAAALEDDSNVFRFQQVLILPWPIESWTHIR